MTQTNDGGATDLTTDALKQPTCRKCGGTMQPGHALGQTYTSGTPDDLGATDGQTMSVGGPGVLIDCRKCEDCGWSVTADPTAQEAVPACKHLRTTHTCPGYDPLRPVVITCDDCGAVLSPDAHPPQPSVSVAEEALCSEILAELTRARTKFPGKNVTFAALVEEVGELATATFEESADRVRKEAVQVAVMAMRMILDGDHCYEPWRAEKGLDPLDPALRALKGGES